MFENLLIADITGLDMGRSMKITVWAVMDLFICACAYTLPNSRLRSGARKNEHISSRKFHATNFGEFLQFRGLHRKPDSVKECNAACWENNGTCNLLSGTCSCPPGREGTKTILAVILGPVVLQDTGFVTG